MSEAQRRAHLPQNRYRSIGSKLPMLEPRVQRQLASFQLPKPVDPPRVVGNDKMNFDGLRYSGHDCRAISSAAEQTSTG
jgi:hypothetical protein